MVGHPLGQGLTQFIQKVRTRLGRLGNSMTQFMLELKVQLAAWTLMRLRVML
jgi:hypothetical protein